MAKRLYDAYLNLGKEALDNFVFFCLMLFFNQNQVWDLDWNLEICLNFYAANLTVYGFKSFLKSWYDCKYN